MLARAGFVVLFAGMLATGACDNAADVPGRPETASKTIVVYDNDTIPGNIAIWNPRGIFVDGFRHASVFVEFEQKTADEHPLSVGVGFAPMESGRLGTRNVYDFSNGSVTDSQSMSVDATMKQPTWISGSGAGTWHGEQGISSFVIRTSILGPYMWVYPLNDHSKTRRFSIAIYLTR